MVVAVQNLTMTYRAPVRQAGLTAAVGSLFRREYREVRAVQGISFAVGPGEVAGFIGPNGAGKTTTLKLLSGILHPTSGTARVLGFLPWRREGEFLRQIAMIRGSQPLGGPAELTVADSLHFQQLIYDVPNAAFQHNLAELTELLDMGPLLPRQVRALSLGERMRCGLALALIYRPRVLFLDEPTVGRDVTAVGIIRRFIAAYSRQTQATILLTSHYMADVEALCKRIVLIDQGTLRYDGDLAELATQLSPYKLVKVVVPDGGPVDWRRYGEVLATEDGKVALRIDRQAVSAVTARL
ncbi:MAG TPA: ATP-binding cassette domain-containing protein, partial [Chloroflexota bacterium]